MELQTIDDSASLHSINLEILDNPTSYELLGESSIDPADEIEVIEPLQQNESENRGFVVFLQYAWDQYQEMTFPPTGFDPEDLKKRGLFLPILFAYQGAFFLLFINLFYFGYKTEISKIYLSPLDGFVPSNCNQIPLSITGRWSVDKNGNWEGSPDYIPADAIYLMEMKNAEVTQEEYSSAINYFEEKIKWVNDMASTRDDEFYVITYSSSSFEYSTRDGRGSITFSSVGDVTALFQNAYVNNLAFLSRAGYCSKPDLISSRIDPVRASLILTLRNQVSYQQSLDGMTQISSLAQEICPGIFEEYWDFVYPYAKVLDEQEVKIDFRSLMTALSVNEGTNSISNLNPAKIQGNLGFFTDNFYKGMDPVICSIPKTTTTTTAAAAEEEEVCMLLIGNNFYYPYFMSGGQWTSDCSNFYLQPCESTHCPSRREPSLIGFIFIPQHLFPNEGSTPIDKLFQHFGSMKSNNNNNNNNNQLKRKFFRVGSLMKMMNLLTTFYLPESTLPSYYDSPNFLSCNLTMINNHLSSSTFLKNQTSQLLDSYDSLNWLIGPGQSGSIHNAIDSVLQDVCGDYNCSFLNLEMSLGHTVTDYYHSLLINSEVATVNYKLTYDCQSDGICGWYRVYDTFYHSSIFPQIRSNPPVILVQAVMNCSTTTQEAIINSGGVALSNTSAVLASFLGFFVIVSTFLWNKRRKHLIRKNQDKIASSDDEMNVSKKMSSKILPIEKKESKKQEVLYHILHTLLQQQQSQENEKLLIMLEETFQT